MARFLKNTTTERLMLWLFITDSSSFVPHGRLTLLEATQIKRGFTVHHPKKLNLTQQSNMHLST
jgi:hypothetical protein